MSIEQLEIEDDQIKRKTIWEGHINDYSENKLGINPQDLGKYMNFEKSGLFDYFINNFGASKSFEDKYKNDLIESNDEKIYAGTIHVFSEEELIKFQNKPDLYAEYASQS